MGTKAKKVELTQPFIEAFSGALKNLVKYYFPKGSILDILMSSKYTSAFWKHLKTKDFAFSLKLTNPIAI